MWISSVAPVPMAWTPNSLRVLAVEEELQHPAVVAEDSAAGDLAIAGQADLVGDFLPSQPVLRQADHRDLGDGVDADGEVGRHRLAVDAEGEARRQPALLAGGGREAGEADGVAAARMCGTLVCDRSLTTIRPRSSAMSPAFSRCSVSEATTRPTANSATSAMIRLPDSSEITACRVGVPATSILATVSSMRKVTLALRIWCISSETISRSRNSSGHARALDHGDPDADGGEHRGILDADHAAADDGHGMREPRHVEDVVAGQHHAVARLGGRRGRAGAAGDEHRAGGQHPLAAFRLDAERVRIDEAGVTAEHRHVVAVQLLLDDLRLAADHVADLRRESCSMVTRRPDAQNGRAKAGSNGRAALTTASRKVLLGIVPVSTHTPPTIRRRSTTATRFPNFAAWTAALCPAGPLPMHTRS